MGEDRGVQTESLAATPSPVFVTPVAGGGGGVGQRAKHVPSSSRSPEMEEERSGLWESGVQTMRPEIQAELGHRGLYKPPKESVLDPKYNGMQG